ncbi:cell differentiation protein rcd1-like [Apium graveolens]|uniref:cell differentiation protein rcd1-like n=1 Tax=Apium graveolens TaxID=4045 RepID=UPI003D793AE1
MGILLWHSYKGVTILVEEVKSTARKLFSKNFTTTDVIRACQAITLLQCLASQRETKQVFLTAKVTDSLCLFLVDMNREEHTLVLRNASLRAISALFEADHPVLADAIDHILKKNMIAFFLGSMENADLHSQWTATFIVSKILMTEEGLSYISAEAEPCFRVIRAYAAVLETLDFTSPIHLLNDIIQSYLRMLDEPRARDALKHHLPLKLGTPIFAAAVARDAGTAQKLELLLHTMSEIQRDEFAPYNNHLQAPSSRLRMIA